MRGRGRKRQHQKSSNCEYEKEKRTSRNESFVFFPLTWKNREKKKRKLEKIESSSSSFPRLCVVESGLGGKKEPVPYDKDHHPASFFFFLSIHPVEAAQQLLIRGQKEASFSFFSVRPSFPPSSLISRWSFGRSVLRG